MITEDLDIFITRYYELNDSIIPNKNSKIYICPQKKYNIDEIIKKVKKNNWLGIVHDNKIILKCIVNIKKKRIFYSNIILTYNWNIWKEIVGYSYRYKPNMLVSSKNPFPDILGS